MSDYTLNIIVNGVDQTGPAQQGMDRLGVGGIAAGNLIAGALQSAAGAVTGFVGSAVSAAGDFQQNLSVLQTASGATAAQMDQMRQMAVALGNDMSLPGASASDAATAMLELSKAGLSVTDTMDAAKGTLQLAAAAETDAATAAQVVSGALNAFGLSGEHATEIADQLAAGANASAASMTDLSDGFKQAGFAFNATGQSTADLISSLAMLTNVGLTGSDAGTALKNAMLQLMAPTDAAAKTMAQYGINVRDAQGNMLPFRDIIGVLDDKLGGLSAAQREMALKTILQGDGMKALLPLLDAGVEGFDAMKAKVMVAGAAEEMAAAQMQGFKGAMGGLSNAVDTLKLAIGTALLPVLTFLINTIASPAINAVTNFIMALQGNADAIGQMSAPMQMLMGFLGDVWTASAQVVEAFNSAGTYSIQFAVALGQLGMAFGLPAELLPWLVLSIQSFVDAIYPALDAIGAFVIGTGDLGTVADFLIDLLGVTLGGILADAIGVLMSYAQVWIDLGATIFNVASALVSGDLAGAWSALTSGLAQVVADYQYYAQSMAALIFDIVNAIVGAVVTYAPLIYAQLVTWGQAFVDWISPYIPIALTYLQTFAASVWAWIVEQAPILYQQVLTWGQAFVDWISPYISLALTALGGFAASIWAWIVEQAPGILDKVMTWGRAFVDWISPYIPIVLTALGEMASSFLSWITAQYDAIVGQVSTWGAAFVEWIPGATVSFLGAWPGMLGSFLDWIAGAVGPILAQLGSWAIAFVQWILPMIPPFLAGLGGLLGALLAFVAETAVVLVTKLMAWGLAFLGWIAVNVLPALPGLLATILAAIVSFISGAVVGIALGVAGWGLAFLAWVKDVVSKIPGALAGILAAMSGWISGAAGKLMIEASKIGQSVVDGIKQGLSNGWGKVVAWLSEKVASIPEPIRKIMGIASPSKVMAKEVGAPIVDGIVAGLVQRSPKAVQAMLDLASSMFDVVSKGVDAFGKLTQLGSIPQSAIANFGDAIQRTLTDFSNRVGQWDKAAMSAASQFTFKAGQVVDFLAKGVELLSGIANMAVPSRDAVTAFADTLAWVMTEIVRVSTFELRLGLTAGVEFASGAGAIVDVIKKGVEALNALADFVKPAPGVITQFVNTIYWLVSKFVEAGQGMSGQGLAAASTFASAAGTIFAVIAAGVDAILKLAEFVKPAPGAIQAFTNTVYWLVSRFVEAGQAISGPALNAATAFADAAGTVVGVIAAGVDGLLKLAEFVKPAPGVVQQFTNSMYWVVSRFVEASQAIGQRGIAAAAAFADGAGKVVSIIGGAVDAFKKLGEIVAPMPESVKILADGLLLVVGGLWFAQRMLAADALAAVVAFAEGAGKVVSIIGGAVDAFAKLPGIIAPAPATVKVLGDGLLLVVGQLWFAQRMLAADALAAVVAFAEGAGKVVGIIGSAVDAFGKLPGIIAPTPGAVKTLGDGIVLVVGGLWFAQRLLAADALQAVVAFAESAGKVLSVIKTGVDGFAAMAELKPVGESSIQLFVEMVNALVTAIAAAAESFSADALAQAQKFADAASGAVGILEKGVDGFLKVDTFTGVSEAAIQRFADGVRLAVAAMAALAAEFGADATAAAKAFAQAAGESTDFLKKGVEGFNKLAELEAVPDAGLKVFAQAVVALINTTIQLSGLISNQMLADATRIANGTDQVITVVKDAIKAFLTLGTATDSLPNYVQDFVNAVARLAKDFQAAVIPPAQNIGLAISLGIAAGISSGTPAIVNAVYAAINQAILAAKAALGIASPSKVFQDQVGLQMAAGMAGGMAMGAPLVDRAVTDVSGRATAAAGAQSGSTSTTNIGGITVNALPGQNPEQIARAAIAEIERRTGRKF